MNSEAQKIVDRANRIINNKLVFFQTAFDKAQKNYKNASKAGDEASVAYYEKDLQSFNLVINELKSIASELK